MERKLERDEQHKMIAGVCAGLANYLNIDVTVIRAIFLVSLVLHGCGILPYIVLWIVMPKRITYYFNTPGFDPTVDYTVPPQSGPPRTVLHPSRPRVRLSLTMEAKAEADAAILVRPQHPPFNLNCRGCHPI